MEEPLVVAPGPSQRVQLRQMPAAQLHVLQRRALGLAGPDRPGLHAGAVRASLQPVLQRGHEARGRRLADNVLRPRSRQGASQPVCHGGVWTPGPACKGL